MWARLILWMGGPALIPQSTRFAPESIRLAVEVAEKGVQHEARMDRGPGVPRRAVAPLYAGLSHPSRRLDPLRAGGGAGQGRGGGPAAHAAPARHRRRAVPRGDAPGRRREHGDQDEAVRSRRRSAGQGQACGRAAGFPPVRDSAALPSASGPAAASGTGFPSPSRTPLSSIHRRTCSAAPSARRMGSPLQRRACSASWCSNTRASTGTPRASSTVLLKVSAVAMKSIRSPGSPAGWPARIPRPR